MRNYVVDSQMYSITVSEINDILNAEITRLQSNRNSNTAKNLQKITMVQEMLQNIPNFVIFNIEGVRGNGLIRDFNLLNLGSITECIVKYHLKHIADNEISKTVNNNYDVKFGCITYEIKASLSANALATPSQSETTILVNRMGIFTIPKNEVEFYVKSNGRLPHNVECGKHLEWLENKIGFWN